MEILPNQLQSCSEAHLGCRYNCWACTAFWSLLTMSFSSQRSRFIWVKSVFNHFKWLQHVMKGFSPHPMLLFITLDNLQLLLILVDWDQIWSFLIKGKAVLPNPAKNNLEARMSYLFLIRSSSECCYTHYSSSSLQQGLLKQLLHTHYTSEMQNGWASSIKKWVKGKALDTS